jgi:hypothetical protein
LHGPLSCIPGLISSKPRVSLRGHRSYR